MSEEAKQVGCEMFDIKYNSYNRKLAIDFNQ